MTLRERIGLGLTRRLLGRLSLAGRVQELEAERDGLTNRLDVAVEMAAQAEHQRDQALRDAEDLRAVVWGLNEDISNLTMQQAEGVAQAAERSAAQMEALRVREEELAAALGLPQRRSWPDLLAAARRTVRDRDEADRRAHDLANRCQVAEVWLHRVRRTASALLATARKIEDKPDRAEVCGGLLKSLFLAATPATDDPDPRQGTPGGADLLAEVAPGTPEFKPGALLYRQPDGTVSPVPPPAPTAPEVPAEVADLAAQQVRFEPPAVVVPNMRRHRPGPGGFDDCQDCGTAFAEMVRGQPCPGPKGAA